MTSCRQQGSRPSTCSRQGRRSRAEAVARGWSVYGVERLQPVATAGKYGNVEKGSDSRKPLPLVAINCRRNAMVRNAMKASRGAILRASVEEEGRPASMLYAGLDLSRKRLDVHLLDGEGATVDVGRSPPDADGLHGLSGASLVTVRPSVGRSSRGTGRGSCTIGSSWRAGRSQALPRLRPLRRPRPPATCPPRPA